MFPPEEKKREKAKQPTYLVWLGSGPSSFQTRVTIPILTTTASLLRDSLLPSSASSMWSIQLGLQPAEPQWRGTSGWQHTALIRVYTQTISSCSRKFAFRPSSSGHRPVTGQAGIWLVCTRGLQVFCPPTSSPLGYKAIMLTFMERRGFKVGEDNHREGRQQCVNNTQARKAPAVLKHFQMLRKYNWGHKLKECTGSF